MVKVWEKQGKADIQGKEEDAFSFLHNEWQFTEIDSFTLHQPKQKSQLSQSEQTKPRTKALFSLSSSNTSICCNTIIQAIIIRDFERHEVNNEYLY